VDNFFRHKKMKYQGLENTCPICGVKITKVNPLVRYHLRYKPPLVILACKFCNFTEFALRNDLKLPKCAYGSFFYPQKDTRTRAAKVLLFHNKLGLQI